MFSLLSNVLSKGMDISERVHGTLFLYTQIKLWSLPDFRLQGFLSVILAHEQDVNHRVVFGKRVQAKSGMLHWCSYC